MKQRDKIAVFIDYALRTPNFHASYTSFKQMDLFTDKNFGVSFEDELAMEGDVRQFWQKQLANPEIEKFYAMQKPPEDDSKILSEGMLKYFYNEHHLNVFLDEYSFNLYTDCVIPNLNDITILNVAQDQLVDVVLIDEFVSKRKIGNTFFFLSKSRVFPHSVRFLGRGQQLDETEFKAIWNPLKNKEHVNAPGKKDFYNWFLKLEENLKNGKL